MIATPGAPRRARSPIAVAGRDLPGALAGGNRRGTELRLDHVMERVARGQRARTFGRVWVPRAPDDTATFSQQFLAQQK
jgi:hypothetical protein